VADFETPELREYSAIPQLVEDTMKGTSPFVAKVMKAKGGHIPMSAELDQADADTSLPILYKPMGSPVPEPTYIASDADYVDYITELMGGFAIPSFLKEYRKQKQYLFMGVRMTRDTERMVLSDIIYAASEPKGWVLLPEPTDKEKRFCKRLGIEIISADVGDLLQAAGMNPAVDAQGDAMQVGS